MSRSWSAKGERGFMRYLDRARSIVRGIYGISLPDPNRIDIGAVRDTVTLLEAIDSAMPRNAVLEVLGLHHGRLAAFLAACPDATHHRADGYLLPVNHGAIGALARVARDSNIDEVCAHLFVHDGDRTLLEAFGRDKGEDVVWLSAGLPRAVLARFLEALATGSVNSRRSSRRLPMIRRPWRLRVLSAR